MSTTVPEPEVPPSAYDEDYYLHGAAGHEQFSAGGAIAGRYTFALAELDLPAGGTLLDIGCGRGELVCHALEQGAGRAIGVEYAVAAIELARSFAADRGHGDRAEFLAADAREVPLPDATANAVALLDVIEHLTTDEQHAALVEARRLLKPGGRFLIHTFPNRLIYETYGFLRRLWPGGGEWPEDPRSEIEHQMHVGELTAAEARQALRDAGFDQVAVDYTPWVYAEHLRPRAPASCSAASPSSPRPATSPGRASWRLPRPPSRAERASPTARATPAPPVVVLGRHQRVLVDRTGDDGIWRGLAEKGCSERSRSGRCAASPAAPSG